MWLLFAVCWVAGACPGLAAAQEYPAEAPALPAAAVEEPPPQDQPPRALKELAKYFVEVGAGASSANGRDVYPGPNEFVGVTLAVEERRSKYGLLRLNARGRYIYSSGHKKYLDIPIHVRGDAYLGGLEVDWLVLNDSKEVKNEEDNVWAAGGGGPFVFLEGGYASDTAYIGNYRLHARGPVLRTGVGVRVIVGYVTVVFPEFYYARGFGGVRGDAFQFFFTIGAGF